MKRILHIVLSVLLGVLLVFSTTPMEYIHLFAGHRDTVHHPHDDDITHVDPEHHHCQFLELSVPPFVNNDATVFIPYKAVVYPNYSVLFEEATVERVVSTRYLRGPPKASV